MPIADIGECHRAHRWDPRCRCRVALRPLHQLHLLHARIEDLPPTPSRALYRTYTYIPCAHNTYTRVHVRTRYTYVHRHIRTSDGARETFADLANGRTALPRNASRLSGSGSARDRDSQEERRDNGDKCAATRRTRTDGRRGTRREGMENAMQPLLPPPPPPAHGSSGSEQTITHELTFGTSVAVLSSFAYDVRSDVSRQIDNRGSRTRFVRQDWSLSWATRRDATVEA